MDLDKARHLVALADHGTFNKAAASVHLTQPAFSRSIRALERELDVQLVDRGARQSRLTPYGELIATRARALLRGVRDTRRMLESLREGVSGELAIGIGPSAAAVVLAEFLAHVARETPTLRVRVESGSVTHLVELLRHERIDVVLGPHRPFATDPEFDVVLVGESRAGAFVRAGHPLLAQGGELSLAQLAGHPVLGPSLGAHVMHVMVEALGPAGHPDRLITMRCDDFAAMRAVVRESDAVLVTMEATIVDELERRILVPLPIPAFAQVDFRIGLASLRDRTLPPAVSRLEAVARRCFAA